MREEEVVEELTKGARTLLQRLSVQTDQSSSTRADDSLLTCTHAIHLSASEESLKEELFDLGATLGRLVSFDGNDEATEIVDEVHACLPRMPVSEDARPWMFSDGSCC